MPLAIGACARSIRCVELGGAAPWAQPCWTGVSRDIRPPGLCSVQRRRLLVRLWRALRPRSVPVDAPTASDVVAGKSIQVERGLVHGVTCDSRRRAHLLLKYRFRASLLARSGRIRFGPKE